MSGLAFKFLFKIEGFGFLAVCMALGVFVYGAMRLGPRFKPLEKLGQNSYAIYLVHFMVLHYWRGLSPWQAGLPALALAVVVITLTSYGLALLIHALVEKRVQRFVEAITRPGVRRQLA